MRKKSGKKRIDRLTSDLWWEIAFDTVSDSIFLLDKKGKIIKCNRAASNLIGKPPGDTIGHFCYEMIHGTPKPIEGCPLPRAKKSLRREEMVLKAGNRWLNISVDPLLDEARRFIGAVHIVSDITERKRAEEQLKEYSTQLEQKILFVSHLLEVSQKMTSTLKLKEVLNIICQSVIDALGYRMVWIGLIDEKNHRVLPAAQAGFEDDYLKSVNIRFDNSPLSRGPTGMAIKTGKAVVQRDIAVDPEFKPWREEALKRGYRSSAAIPMILKGRVIGTLNVYSEKENGFTDNDLNLMQFFSTSAAIAIENSRLFEELGEQLERKMDFTNMAAHELRTPLVPILGYLQILKEKTEDERLLEYIEIMERNAQRQRRLIDRMLELSRLDAGSVKLEYSIVKVNDFVRSLIDNYAPTGRKLHIDIPEEMLISVDEDKFFQILDNLISNAIKYSPDDTEIKIYAEERSRDYLFKVIDRGEGVPVEEQKRIFERFYIIGGSKNARKSRRTGLGLALAKGYVESQGGKIWVESEPEKGATFCFTVPK